VAGIIKDTAERAPELLIHTDDSAQALAVLDPILNLYKPTVSQLDKQLSTGIVQTRNGAVTRALELTRDGLPAPSSDDKVRAPWMPTKRSSNERYISFRTCLRLQELTFEQALFPALFPQGTGFYDGSIPFDEYCKLRCSQFFTVYSMTPAYILYLFTQRQAKHMMTYMSRVALEEDFCRLKEKHPDHDERTLFKMVRKHNIPGSALPCSNFAVQTFGVAARSM
jgi:hypothetical protein